MFFRKGRLWCAVAGSAAVGSLLIAGCANPGPAKPPSLNLPEIASGLTAERVGDIVRLQWSTPERTTDHMPLKGTVTAEICRESGAAAAALAASVRTPVGATSGMDKGAGEKAVRNRPLAAGAQACFAVTRMVVQPGASEASDALLAELASGQAGLVGYRVQLRNAAGKTAGPSVAVFVSAGPAPEMVKGLRGRADKVGAVLEWQAASGEKDVVELQRKTVAPAGGGSDSAKADGATGAGKAPAEVRLRVGAANASGGSRDVGGAIDRTAKIGEMYLYTAVRVRTAVMDGQSVEVRSGSSAEVKVEMADVFSPEAPVGLVASPGFVRGADGAVVHAAIDLSWEPGMEPRIAGYWVYRRIENGGAGDSGEWVRLNAELVPVPAYRDATVETGIRYGYRVTAVDTAGHESGPGNVAAEVGPGQ